jgi:hypothetical protein
MSPGQRMWLVLAAGAQLSLAVTAWTNLARRPPGEVRGKKWQWALVIGVNFVGPISYFRWGRVHRAQA